MRESVAMMLMERSKRLSRHLLWRIGVYLFTFTVAIPVCTAFAFPVDFYRFVAEWAECIWREYTLIPQIVQGEWRNRGRKL